MTLDLATRARKHAAQKVLRDIHQAQKAERPVVERVKREKRVAHVNVKADRGRVRDNGYLAFLRRQPCSVGHIYGFTRCSGHIDAAHIRTHKPGGRPTGMQRKPDDCRATSLCRRHHTEQHDAGNELRWWQGYGLDPFETAERLFAAYEAQG